MRFKFLCLLFANLALIGCSNQSFEKTIDISPQSTFQLKSTETLKMSWASLFDVSYIPIKYNEDRNVFELDLRKHGLSTCLGKLHNKDPFSGTWTLYCKSKKMAEGSFETLHNKKSKMMKSYATGKDTSGDQIRFQFYTPRSSS